MKENGKKKFEHYEMFTRHSLMLYVQYKEGLGPLGLRLERKMTLISMKVNHLVTTKTLHFYNI